jgi:hypothetical protein
MHIPAHGRGFVNKWTAIGFDEAFTIEYFHGWVFGLLVPFSDHGKYESQLAWVNFLEDCIGEFFGTGFSEADEFFGSEFIVEFESVNVTFHTVETEDVVAGGEYDWVLFGDEADRAGVVWVLHLDGLLIILCLLALKCFAVVDLTGFEICK